jgi:acetolactate synthase-1/2/3 large subunit
MSIVGGTLVALTLKRLGIKHLPTLPGHQILSVYAACQQEHLDLISTRHEASAVFMAQALSFSTREPGVVLLAGGPELTNAMTAIAQAFYANTPLVVVAGANTMQKRDKGFPQDMDQLPLVRPFTKWARSCHDVRRIPEYITAAYRHAARGRPGPTYVEIPYDVMEARIPSGEAVFPRTPDPIAPAANMAALEAVASVLQRAKRPIAIVGSGALWSRAEAALLSFTQRTRLPLFFTSGALAMPFPDEEVFGLGAMGIGRPSMQAITEADVLLLLGTRLNFSLGFGQPPFLSPRQKIVQVDIASEEIDSTRRAELGIAADLRLTLEQLNALNFPMPSLDAWRARLRGKIDRYEATLARLAERDGGRIHPLRLVREIEAIRTEDSFLVLDGANSILWALMAYRARPAGGDLLSTLGELQAIGAGVPQALALKRAHPGRQVILHTGDGSFGYGAMEMETASRYGIPIVVVVHNDSGWGMTREMQAEFFGDSRASPHDLGTVRYDRLVEALGGHGEFVDTPDAIRPALERALRSGRPACVNVMVDPRPKSPGLQTFMLMEVMLGKETAYDRVPTWMRRLGRMGLEGAARRAMLRYLDRMLHKDIG